MTRRVLKYVTYTVTSDDSAEREYEAECVTGEDADCGARSGCFAGPDTVAAWQLAHAQQTGHTRFRRTLHDYSLVAPTDGARCAVVPTGPGLQP